MPKPKYNPQYKPYKQQIDEQISNLKGRFAMKVALEKTVWTKSDYHNKEERLRYLMDECHRIAIVTPLAGKQQAIEKQQKQIDEWFQRTFGEFGVKPGEYKTELDSLKKLVARIIGGDVDNHVNRAIARLKQNNNFEQTLEKQAQQKENELKDLIDNCYLIASTIATAPPAEKAERIEGFKAEVDTWFKENLGGKEEDYYQAREDLKATGVNIIRGTASADLFVGEVTTQYNQEKKQQEITDKTGAFTVIRAGDGMTEVDLTISKGENKERDIKSAASRLAAVFDKNKGIALSYQSEKFTQSENLKFLARELALNHGFDLKNIKFILGGRSASAEESFTDVEKAEIKQANEYNKKLEKEQAEAGKKKVQESKTVGDIEEELFRAASRQRWPGSAIQNKLKDNAAMPGKLVDALNALCTSADAAKKEAAKAILDNLHCLSGVQLAKLLKEDKVSDAVRDKILDSIANKKLSIDKVVELLKECKSILLQKEQHPLRQKILDETLFANYSRHEVIDLVNKISTLKLPELDGLKEQLIKNITAKLGVDFKSIKFKDSGNRDKNDQFVKFIDIVGKNIKDLSDITKITEFNKKLTQLEKSQKDNNGVVSIEDMKKVFPEEMQKAAVACMRDQLGIDFTALENSLKGKTIKGDIDGRLCGSFLMAIKSHIDGLKDASMQEVKSYHEKLVKLREQVEKAGSNQVKQNDLKEFRQELDSARKSCYDELLGSYKTLKGKVVPSSDAIEGDFLKKFMHKIKEKVKELERGDVMDIMAYSKKLEDQKKFGWKDLKDNFKDDFAGATQELKGQLLQDSQEFKKQLQDDWSEEVDKSFPEALQMQIDRKMAALQKGDNVEEMLKYRRKFAEAGKDDYSGEERDLRKTFDAESKKIDDKDDEVDEVVVADDTGAETMTRVDY